MGLSCYWTPSDSLYLFVSFNALMGLSCYAIFTKKMLEDAKFQCPHGLELLLQECPIFQIFHDTFYAYLLFIGVY